MYIKINEEFNRVLKTIGMDERKEGMNRRKTSLHSFRRYVKTVTANQTSSDFSEWLLGHRRSPYWTMKQEQRGEIYKQQLMPFLTFLDYGALESSSKGIVSQLENKDKEIAYLRERDLKHEIEMKAMNDKLERIDGVLNKIGKLEKELGIK